MKNEEGLLKELEEARSKIAEMFGGIQAAAEKIGMQHQIHFLQTLIDTIPSPIFYKDKEGKYLGCNTAFEKAMGRSREEIVGKTVFDLAPEDLARKYFEMDSELFRNSGVQTYETRVKYADGKLRDIIFNKAVYRSPDGGIAGLVGVMTDITAYRETEEALRKSEEKYRRVFEESKDVIFVSSIEGGLLELNPAGLEAFGYSSNEELKNINIGRDLYQNPRDRLKFIEEISRKGFVKDYEVKAKTKDGRGLVFSMDANTVNDACGNISAYRGILRDVTLHKELEEQLVQSQKMEAIGKLTGGIAHDFNNMLMAISGHATLIQTKLQDGHPAYKNLESLLGVTEKASALTKRLLAFGRKQILYLKKQDLNGIITGAESLLSRLIGEHIDFSITLSGNYIVMADSTQIEQVLLNLATNARDAMPEGGRLSIKTDAVDFGADFREKHGYGEPGSYACITVEDSGVGMSHEVKGRIFDPFFTTKEIGKGTGLGLSIVYGIIKQHNGYINVESEPGKGSTFRIYLPALKDKPENRRTLSIQFPSFSAGIGTILVTEDDEEVRKVTKEVLGSCGYTVIEAVDGEDAVRKFIAKKDGIDLVMLDIIMPRKSGREAYEEIKKISPDMKVIFLSGYNEELINKNEICGRGVAFLQKPVSPAALLETVKGVLEVR